ncbi:bifunctional folylpolyglutamate synthase/dihydrofolate synthase [Gorillibacterium timonense]|uniref:bifunctional folylpolyglutamate synthase/dihydrofolate synthase n=1 Tax=Gorillibacterium timonense TaxID=1689269 RepID=UPI00071C9359|nr:folylpolyglutamate synthase/dihydrofolate synthase family protein [Gorillibacterium timonense]
MTGSRLDAPDRIDNGGSPLEKSGEAAPFKTYEEAVDWINSQVPLHGIRQGLGRMERLMELLDHPERRLRFIHVAGTNGKGSTCAFLTEALLRNGYDVGTFTSPYIVKFTNRLQYNGRDIPEEVLLRLTNLVKPLADEMEETEQGAPTMFELVTTIAILYFARVVFPDYVVWEAGLGGRRDCTNIVTPVLSIITNIGHDHMEIIGDTIAAIAEEKAGIVKPGVPLVSAVEQREALDVIEGVCREKRSTLYLLGREYQFRPEEAAAGKQSMSFQGPFRAYESVPVSLNGPHQFKNASVALMALEVLRQYGAVQLEEELLYAAFRHTRWPGRLELVREEPRLLLDGAHNPEGGEALASALRESFRYRKLHLMIGMIASKDHSGFLRHVLPLADSVIFTEPDYHKKLDAAELTAKARSLMEELHLSLEVSVQPEWKLALERLTEQSGEGDLAVVSGTLYLISDVRSWVLNRSESEKGW